MLDLHAISTAIKNCEKELTAELRMINQEMLDNRHSNRGKMEPIKDEISFYFAKQKVIAASEKRIKELQRVCPHKFSKWGYPDDGVNFDLCRIRKCPVCGLVQREETKK